VIPERARALLRDVEPLADRFAAEGMRLFLVGGAVRDLFARPLADDADADGASRGPDDDVDLTTNARPEEVKRIVAPVVDALWSQGERFGTIGCKIGGTTYEITTHRAEAYRPDSRKPDVAYSEDVEADLSRRDFTVNAMALEVTTEDPTLIDPFDGVGDLAARVLRTPLDPESSFSDDPLRMLRAARFIARFGLVPTPELVAAVRDGAERLAIVSAERIRDELTKLVMVRDPSDGLWFVHDTGLADLFLPELPAMRLEQDPIHRHKDVLSHTIAVVAKAEREPLVRLAALFHDVGKPKTRSIGGKGVSFHHHEVVGARMTRDRMKALRYPNDVVDDVTQLVYLHLRFHTYQMGWTDAAVRRFVRDAGPLLPQLIALTRADCTTRNRRKAEALDRRIDDLEDRIAELRQREELAALRPDLDGRAVMDHLGLPPGPVVGQALAHLLEVRLDQGPLPREAALEELDRWWAERPSEGLMGTDDAADGREGRGHG
jgi:poly(A) polymerase